MSGMAAIALASMGGVTFGATASSIVHVLVRGGVMPRRPRPEPTWTRAEVDRLTAAAYQHGQVEAALGGLQGLMAHRAVLSGKSNALEVAAALGRGELPEGLR